ncbi:MAG: restriction endonuclease subunit S [Bacteroides sp.]|nr:restriction endonuclease subunit S [Bacteroides sp.]
MSEWKKVTLDQMGIISRGKSKHRPRNDARLFGGRYPFIQTGDIGTAGLYVTEYSQTYNEEGLAQSKLWEKDTLCITIAANIADTALLAFPACFPDSIMGFIPYDNIANVKFVKYCFDILQRDCQQISQGTAQDNLSWKKLSTILFLCPPIEVQNKIADILSRYDSLIENYQKQIKLLEESAQRLYKEWFIDLRFPGHENTKIVDGVPEGWEKKKVGDLISKVVRTKQVSANNYLNSGCIPVIDQSRNYIAGYTNDIECLVEVTTPYIVFGDHTRVLKYVPFSFAKGADGTQIIMSNDLERMPQSLFYNSLIEIDLSNYSYARHFKYLKEELVLLPSKYIAERFDKVVSQYFQSIQKNREQIRLLTEARDRLLPKLMSGEIEV